MSWLFQNHIFISYSSADGEWVAQLEEDLRREFRVFRDKHGISPGEDWQKRIDRELEQSLIGIVVLSPEAMESKMVTYEWMTLSKRLKEKERLITLLYRDVPKIPGPLQTIQYIDFRDPAERPKKLEELRKTVRELLKGCEPPGMPLIKVLLLVLMMLAVPVIIKGAYDYLQDNKSINALRRTQREVQSIEERLAGFINQTPAMWNGEQRHVVPATGEHLITDHWENGLLIWRGFYARGRLIARDTFSYNGDMVIEKVRSYMDDEQRPFLIDHFTQDGSLTKKRYCRLGPEQPCDLRVDDMRSPLPPPALMVYR